MKSSAVKASMEGYRHEIGALQYRHFRPSRRKEKTGTRSAAKSRCSHFGQYDHCGTVKLPPRGSRQITTFKNEPMLRPKMNAQTTAKTVGLKRKSSSIPQ